MRIIQLGHINLTFSCPECHTVFEISTDEIEKVNDRYIIRCPLCGYEWNWTNDQLLPFMRKREELKKQMEEDLENDNTL